MSTDHQSPFVRLPELQGHIRRAVEERNYALVLSLVEEQQAMFHSAGRGHPEVPHFARLSHDLTVWALTMVRLQHAHTESAIRRLASSRRISDNYHSSSDPAAVFGDHSGRSPFVAEG